MHETGLKTIAALRERFPHLELAAFERNGGNMLRVTFWIDGKRFAVQSPDNVDYRQFPYLWWLHRFGVAVKGKVQGV